MSLPRVLRPLFVLCLIAGTACRSGDSAGSSEAAEKACAAGDKAACESAVGLLQEACHRGQAAACQTVAELYLTGRAGAIDKLRAVGAYERGCDAGDAKACERAGLAFARKERSKAEAYFEKACERGRAEGCLHRASFLRERDAERRQDEIAALTRRAKDIYGKACSTGDPEGCFGMAGAVRMDSEDEAQQYFREAMKIWQPRCEAGDVYACYRLGVAYSEESGVPLDDNRSRQLLERACGKGYLDACSELAQAFKSSDATDDDPRAAELFAQACAAGREERSPCREAGFMYAEGEGVRADKPQALLLLENGCNLGDEWCCFKLGSMLLDGDGVPTDPARGAELTRAANGLEFRVVEVKRGTKMVDPGLTAFGIPESSLTPTRADKGQELILVAMEARRTADTARLPVRKMYLVDADGKRYENHTAGDNAFGDRPLERREFLFKVPAGVRPVKMKFELGGVSLDLKPETKAPS